MIMIKTGKKSLSEMKEKLHRMRMEIQGLEEDIEECERKDNYDYDDDYDSRRRNRRDDDDRERERTRRSRYDY